MADVSGDRPWYEELAPDLEGDAGRGVEGSRVDSRRRVMAVWRGFEDSRAGVWLAEHTRLLAGLSSEGSVLVRRLAVGVLLVAMAFTLLLFAAAGGDPVAGGRRSSGRRAAGHALLDGRVGRVRRALGVLGRVP